MLGGIKEALRSLELEPSRGSFAGPAPTPEHLWPCFTELAFLIRKVGRPLTSRTVWDGEEGAGRGCGMRGAYASWHHRGFPRARWDSGALAARTPSPVWALGGLSGPGPPGLRPRPSPGLPGSGQRGALGSGQGPGDGRERGDPGRTGRAGWRAPRAFPLPRGPSASRRDVTGHPPAPRSSGQSACGRRAHGPAGRAGSGRPGRGGAARSCGRGCAPGPLAPSSGFPCARDVVGPGDLWRPVQICPPILLAAVLKVGWKWQRWKDRPIRRLLWKSSVWQESWPGASRGDEGQNNGLLDYQAPPRGSPQEPLEAEELTETGASGDSRMKTQLGAVKG
uniref:collagen alpha-1(I) chain-like isoform X2 n=1 Tax=Callithrix jacchus TaxID=9483 RepID=UPI0023DD474F|nr:collagen alpha-1(I) chain-like isoform X2 [Callithrix jacchus]